MALWPLRVYPRKKRAGQRFNLTPTLDLGPPATTEARPGPKGKGKERGLSKIAEKAEWGRLGGSGSELPSPQLKDTGEKSLQESNPCEETQNEIAPLSESVTDDLQVDSSSSDSELVSGPSLQHDISSSLLSYSVTESYTEFNSVEENLSSFSSPELFRGSNYLDWECPKLTEHVQCKNSTLLDSSKAVAVEKAPEFSNLSAILDNADCEVLLAEKICPSTSEETEKKPEKDSEDRATNIQTKLNHHAQIDTVSSHHRLALESSAPSSVTGVLLPQPLAPALKTNSHIPNKRSGGLVTSTPSSETAGFVFPSNRPEICCIIKASPGVRQMKSKGVIIKKKRYSPPRDIPQDIITKANGKI
ncbi:meiosis-specific kinetochore protein isoform X2 [Heterocephalus glaber]|uniref:Meiosis-specific kinetochore protein isoform X2 n=1 Tax=Heterocephalus glaber TaxID=10181 RepID=A0AAX6RK02_HETGA|nr:meiosis-specific kinetochore protein isoform X2 [Heterocephalus glaber]